MKKLLLVCVMAACGGGGGPVDSGKQVKDLTVGEATDECNYLKSTYPQKTYTCTVQGQTETFHIGFDGDCTNVDVSSTPATCTATVGDLEDCLDAEYSISQDTLCNDIANNTQPDEPASCQKIDSAACQSDDTTNRRTIDSLLHVSALVVAG